MLVGSTDPDDELPEIPQVKDVMKFSRGGKESLQAIVVNLYAVFEDGSSLFLLWMPLKRDIQNSCEYPGESVFIEVCD